MKDFKYVEYITEVLAKQVSKLTISPVVGSYIVHLSHSTIQATILGCSSALYQHCSISMI